MKTWMHPILFLVLYYGVMTGSDVYFSSVFLNYVPGFIILIIGYIFLTPLIKINSRVEFCCFWMIGLLLFCPKFHQVLYGINPSFRFRYVLPVLFLSVLAIIVWTIIRRPKVRSTLKVLSLISLALLFSEVAISIPRAKTGRQMARFIMKEKSKRLEYNFSSYPNIYHITFDGYSGLKALEENWSFRNDRLKSCMESYGIKTNPECRTVYDNTLKSIASLFNQNEFSDVPNVRGMAANSGIFLALINDNNTVRNLLSHGYDIENLSFLKIGDKDEIFEFPWFESNLNFPSLLFNKSTLGVIGKTMAGRKIYQYNLDVLSGLRSAIKAGGKRYVYAHFIMPHTPHDFDEEGNRIPTSDSDESYMGELKFSNDIICDLLEERKSRDPASIIIIQSDHGSARNESELEKYNILNLSDVPEEFDIRLQDMDNNIETYRRVFRGLSK